jgi:hypothetical protein
MMQLLAPCGLLLADQPFTLPDCMEISGEAGVDPSRYLVYRR